MSNTQQNRIQHKYNTKQKQLQITNKNKNNTSKVQNRSKYKTKQKTNLRITTQKQIRLINRTKTLQKQSRTYQNHRKPFQVIKNILNCLKNIPSHPTKSILNHPPPFPFFGGRLMVSGSSPGPIDRISLSPSSP